RDDGRNADATTQEGAEQVQPDHPPEFLDRRYDNGVVLWRGTAGVVVQHMQAAELLHGGADRLPQAGFVGDVGANGDRAIAGKVCGFLARSGIDLGDRYLGAFMREQDGGGAADAGTGAG